MAEKVKGVVDIVFLMDATGSMQNCIDKLKENVKLFIAAMTKKNANNESPVKDWRAKVVGFRDYEADGKDNWLVDNDFTSDEDVLRGQLVHLKAFGGGDIPEDLLDALFAVINMGSTNEQEPPAPGKWRFRRSAARIIIVFTDAGFHEPARTPGAFGAKVEDIINVIHSNRVILSIYAPRLDAEGSLIAADYARLAQANRAEFNELVDEDGNSVTLDEFTSDIENFQNTLRALAKTVTKSAAVDIL